MAEVIEISPVDVDRDGKYYDLENMTLYLQYENTTFGSSERSNPGTIYLISGTVHFYCGNQRKLRHGPAEGKRRREKRDSARG